MMIMAYALCVDGQQKGNGLMGGWLCTDWILFANPLASQYIKRIVGEQKRIVGEQSRIKVGSRMPIIGPVHWQ